MLDRLFHHFALGSQGLRELSFDLECRRYAGQLPQGPPPSTPVFIAGLARAGTSVFTRLLCATGQFASLTYRDLPFPLAPNIWGGISERLNRSVIAQERGHGDGLLHDLDTPEAIEEVFWRTFEGERYITPAGLKPIVPDAETLEQFALFIRLVELRYRRPRYLSKNNNNVLRVAAIAEKIPAAVFVYPFRDPVQHAASLLGQHKQALRLHADDHYRVRFMNWLGHHEFGAGRRPFLFPGAPGLEDQADSIDYWLRTWTSVYRVLLGQSAKVASRRIFLDYDIACRGDGKELDRLARHVGVVSLSANSLRPPASYRVEGADVALIAEAQVIHEELCALARS